MGGAAYWACFGYFYLTTTTSAGSSFFSFTASPVAVGAGWKNLQGVLLQLPLAKKAHSLTGGGVVIVGEVVFLALGAGAASSCKN